MKWSFSHTNQPLGHVKVTPADAIFPRQRGTVTESGAGTSVGALGEAEADARTACFGPPCAPSAPTKSVIPMVRAARMFACQCRRMDRVSALGPARAYVRSAVFFQGLGDQLYPSAVALRE